MDDVVQKRYLWYNDGMRKTTGSLLLLLTALIWGAAFVAQRTGMDHVGPFTFQTARSMLGALALVPVIIWQKKRLGRAFRMPTLAGSLCCGLALTVAATLQQMGLVYTSASKAGFIGSLYVVFVPLISLFLGRKAGKMVWIGVGLTIAGMFFISGLGSGKLVLQKGDFLLLLSAICYAVHILVVAHFAPYMDGVALSCAQFIVAAVCTLPLALIFEHPTAEGLLDAKWALLYTGVLSSGVGYTLQIIGQKYVHSAVASLLMSLESVFSLLAGMLLLKETLKPMEWWGCALVLGAVMISQLPDRKKA